MKSANCYISKKKLDMNDLVSGKSIRPQLLSLIQKEYPGFKKEHFISLSILNQYRKQYVEGLIRRESRRLSKLEKEVVRAIHDRDVLSENIETDIETSLTFGQKIADKTAEFGGSWPFIIFFFIFLTSWIGANIWFLKTRPFDPYPFILLNLILSCIAAIQAPIIMMSQNRQEEKDRIRSINDYKTNLKAELEVRLLHEKIDYIINHQNKQVLETQEVILDYLDFISGEMKAQKKPKK